MRPDQHVLAMRFRRDRLNLVTRKIGIDLQRCRARAMGFGHGEFQIGVRRDGARIHGTSPGVAPCAEATVRGS